MSTTTVILLIAGIVCYVGFVAFVLALLAVARRADEVAEQDARVLASRRERFTCLGGEVDHDEVTAGDVEFREGRTARRSKDVGHRAMR